MKTIQQLNTYETYFLSIVNETLVERGQEPIAAEKIPDHIWKMLEDHVHHVGVVARMVKPKDKAEALERLNAAYDVVDAAEKDYKRAPMTVDDEPLFADSMESAPAVDRCRCKKCGHSRTTHVFTACATLLAYCTMPGCGCRRNDRDFYEGKETDDR